MKHTNIPLEFRPLRTQKQVGSMLGLSRAAVYEAERTALLKLRDRLAHHDPRPSIRERKS